MTGEIVIAVLGFLGGVGAVIVKGLFDRRRVNVDVESVQVQNALAVVEPLHRIIGALEDRLARMSAEIANVQAENAALRADLTTAKHELGILRRAEKESLVERTEVAVKLRESGVDVPLPHVRSDRTRADDLPGMGREAL